VVRLITENHIVSIEGLLPLLPASFRSGFTLVRNSLSLQSASVTNPRAIVYGQDGRLLMAFNGNSSQDGFDNLEMIQFRGETQSFEMHLIQFPGTQSSIREPQFSDPNPHLCLACHGENPRPNWEAYPIWPGLYGENNDELDGKELDAYLSFKELQAQHSRYKWLLSPGSSSESPYRSVNSFDRQERPNLKLTKFLARLNAKRLASILSKASPAEQAQIERGLVGCSDDESLVHDLVTSGLSAQEWNTAFRRFFVGPSTPPPSAALYSFSEGSFDLKDLVAASLMDAWVKAGDSEMAIYYKLNKNIISGDRGDLDDFINGLGAPLDLSSAFIPLCELLSRRMGNGQMMGVWR
jgi:hypothetical protein